MTYAAAGVDMEAADRLVERIAPRVRRTFTPRVLGSFGGFAGAFRLDFPQKLFAREYRDPVLVACTDGVGSKLVLAARSARYDTIGIDLVAMNVNDLITTGAEPLFMLDYVAVHRLRPEVVASIIEGVAVGCEMADCALLGGETAEMPDLYRRGDFDLAGFAVGVVERRRMIVPRLVRAGDDIVGLASDGLHSNGYALARKVLLDRGKLPLKEPIHSLGEPLIDALLRPTRIYVRAVRKVLSGYDRMRAVRGMAHVTGSGIPGNLPRMLPGDLDIVIHKGAWPIPPIFGLIEHCGVDEEEMYRVFNMGIGFALAVRPKSTARIMSTLERSGERPFVIGRARRGRGQLEIR